MCFLFRLYYSNGIIVDYTAKTENLVLAWGEVFQFAADKKEKLDEIKMITACNI